MENNSGTVVANIWKTGDPATSAPLRINSLGTIELRSQEVGIDGDAPIVEVSGSIGSNDAAVKVNDRWQTLKASLQTESYGTQRVLMAMSDNVIGQRSARRFTLDLGSNTSAEVVAALTPSSGSSLSICVHLLP